VPEQPPLQQGRDRRDLFHSADDTTTSPSPPGQTSLGSSAKEPGTITAHTGADSTGGQAKAINTGRLSLRSPSSPTAQRPPEGRGNGEDRRRKRIAFLSPSQKAREEADRTCFDIREQGNTNSAVHACRKRHVDD